MKRRSITKTLLIVVGLWILAGALAGEPQAAGLPGSEGTLWVAPDEVFALVVPEGWTVEEPPPGPLLEMVPSGQPSEVTPERIWILATDRIVPASMPKDATALIEAARTTLENGIRSLNVSESEIRSYGPNQAGGKVEATYDGQPVRGVWKLARERSFYGLCFPGPAGDEASDKVLREIEEGLQPRSTGRPGAVSLSRRREPEIEGTLLEGLQGMQRSLPGGRPYKVREVWVIERGKRINVYVDALFLGEKASDDLAATARVWKAMRGEIHLGLAETLGALGRTGTIRTVSSLIGGAMGYGRFQGREVGVVAVNCIDEEGTFHFGLRTKPKAVDAFIRAASDSVQDGLMKQMADSVGRAIDLYRRIEISEEGPFVPFELRYLPVTSRPGAEGDRSGTNGKPGEE